MTKKGGCPVAVRKESTRTYSLHEGPDEPQLMGSSRGVNQGEKSVDKTVAQVGRGAERDRDHSGWNEGSLFAFK